MLKPSYSELMQVLNNDPDLDSKITSRYAVVIAASKRARQLIDGAEPQADAETNKAVSIAVMEMSDGLIKIIPESEEEAFPETETTPASYLDTAHDAESGAKRSADKAEAYADAYKQFDQFDGYDDEEDEEDDDAYPEIGFGDGLEDDPFDEE
jgi:DNA-directed RNA polymerase subunit omega